MISMHITNKQTQSLLLSGILIGLSLNLVVSFKSIVHPLSSEFWVYLISFIVSLSLPFLLVIRDGGFFDVDGLTIFRIVFIGIALTSAVFASYSFFQNVEWFVSGRYKTQWNISGLPATFYEPELIYGLLKSTFLTSIFAFIERLLKYLIKEF